MSFDPPIQMSPIELARAKALAGYSLTTEERRLVPPVPHVRPFERRPKRSDEASGLFGDDLIRVSDVHAKRVDWLWGPSRLPRGKLVVIDGDPGLSKSTMVLDFGARITTGSPWPDGEPMRTAGNVVILSAEDGIADTIRPRLEAHGAHLERVTVFDSVACEVDGKPSRRPPSIPQDLPRLRSIIVAESAVLVVVDPWAAFLNTAVDSHRDQDVRGALHPLSILADETGATVVLIRHLSKSGGANPLYRGGGSIGIIGAARAGMLVAPDPDDESRRILATTKSNLGPIPTALAYRVVTDGEYGCARIEWDGTTAHRAADLLAVPGSADDETEDACGVLAAILESGPQWVNAALEQMAAAGFSKDQAKRAKGKLRVCSLKVGKPGDAEQGWQWHLPARRRAHEESEGSGTQNPTPFAPLAHPSPTIQHHHDRARARAADALDE